MKKIKILLFVMISIFVLSINNKVTAKDAVIGWMECKYEFNNKDAIQTDMAKGGVATFYYTELYFTDSNKKGRVYYQRGYAENEILFFPLSRLDGKSNYMSISSKYGTKNLNMLDQTFGKELAKYNECPEYFVLAREGDKGAYTPYFANYLANYCSDDQSNCPVIGTNIDEEIMWIGSDERTWEMPFSGKKACDGANVSIYLSGGKFRARITYPKTSSFYSKASPNGATVDIISNDDAFGTISMLQIYNLLKENKLGRGYLNGKKGKERFSLDAYSGGSNECYWVGTEYVTPKNNCYRYSESYFSDEVFKFYEEFFYDSLELYKNFARARLNHWGAGNLDGAHYYFADDYLDYTDKEELDKILQELKSLKSREHQITQAHDAYRSNLKNMLEQMCADPKLERAANSKLQMADIERNSHTAWMELIKQAIVNAGKRSDELGYEDLYQEALDEEQRLEEEIERITYNYYVHKLDWAGEDIHLSFGTGCGVISNNLKHWLNQLLDIMKISALVLTLVLGMLDFFKGVASGNADTMKKVWKNFSRRLLAVSLLFLLPVILEFILGLIDIVGLDSANPLCGIK